MKQIKEDYKKTIKYFCESKIFVIAIILVTILSFGFTITNSSVGMDDTAFDRYYDGKEMKGYEGEPIAAALKAAGVMVHRYPKKHHEPRGIFCAIGRCTDCVMVVDGKPNVRTCVTPLREGMHVQTQYGVGTKEDTEYGEI